MFEACQAAEALHMATGIPHEADHFVQLIGKYKAGEQVISGLHVAWNPRPIRRSLNRKRSDWFNIAGCESEEPTDDEILAHFDGQEGEDDAPFLICLARQVLRV